MGTKSTIEWTDRTWNPIVGCSKCSAGCDNCYAERMAARQAYMGNHNYLKVVNHIVEDLSGENVVNEPDFWFEGWTGKTDFVESAIEKPLYWKTPQHIFVCSMSDLFHPSVPFEWIADVWRTMAFCPQHTFQVLTKRIERALEFVKWLENKHTYDGGDLMFKNPDGGYIWKTWPLPNVWLGTTAENQEMADKRIPDLLKCPAAKRFVSVEPMLSAVDLEKAIDVPNGRYLNYLRGDYYVVIGKDENGQAIFSDRPYGAIGRGRGVDWVICGGESGPGARPMHPDWARGLRDQCKAAGVPFFFKQWGEYAPLSNWHVMVPEGNYAFTPAGQKITPKDNDPKHHVWPATENDGYKNDDEFSSYRVGKKKAGCLLDGVEHKEFPS